MVECEICIPGGWKNVARQKRKRAKHRQYSACIRRSSLHQTVSRVCTSDERRFLYIIYNSVVPSGVFLRVLACFSRTTIPLLSLSLSLSTVSLIHVRYVRNLAVANSCTNVNAGRDGFTNCFSLPPPTADPFYVSSFFSLSLFFSFLPLSFALSLPLVSVYTYTWPRAVSRKFHICFRFPAPSLAEQEESPGREKRRKGKMVER